MNNQIEIEDIDDIGIYIRSTRLGYTVSQALLSEISGVTRATISNLENGKADNVKWSTIEKLLKTLKIKIILVETLNE